MKISRTSSFKSVFVLTDKEIIKLFHLISNFSGQPKIEIYCKDNLTREYDNIEQVLAYENMKGKEITSIKLSSYGKDDLSGRKVYLTFDNSEFSNVYIKIEGPERETTELNEKFGERFESIRPWYSFLSKVDFTYLFIGLYLFLVAIIILMVLLGNIKLVDSERSDLSKSIGYLIGLVPFIVGVLFNKVKSKVFPSSSFAINQGLKRYNNLENFRFIILGGFLVSIVASFFLALF